MTQQRHNQNIFQISQQRNSEKVTILFEPPLREITKTKLMQQIKINLTLKLIR